MAADLCTLAVQLGLACLPHTVRGPVPLASPYIACREERVITALHAAGSAFQRRLDDALGSGACRVFAKGTKVRDALVDTTMRSFVDPGTGRRYFAYLPR